MEDTRFAIVQKYRAQTKLAGARKIFHMINEAYVGISEHRIQNYINADEQQPKVIPSFRNKSTMRTIESICVNGSCAGRLG